MAITESKKALLTLIVLGAALVLFLPAYRNRRVTINTVAPDSPGKMRLEALPTPAGEIPRFNKADVGDVDTPELAINAANKIAEKLITDIASNPLKAIRNLLPDAQLIPSLDPAETGRFTTMYDVAIIEAATENNIPPELLKQLLIKESGLDPAAIGDNGNAEGIAQFHKAAFGEVAKGGNRLDPFQAIPAAARYIRLNMRRTDGTLNAALQAYNGGSGNWQNNTVSDAAKEYAMDIIKKSGIYAEDDFSDVSP